MLSQAVASVVSATAPVTVTRLVPDPPTAEIGWSVALDGGVVLAGAPRYDNPELFFLNEGAAFVFDLSTGQQLRLLFSPSPWQYEEFGYALSICGNRAIIGAPYAGATDHSGAAYIFQVDTGAALHRVTPRDPQREGKFGHSVSIRGSYALVGAPWYENMLGSAYVFDVETGRQLAKLSITATSARDWFGWSVDMNHLTAIVGAPGGFTISRGNAYLFDLATGAQRAQLVAPDLVAGSRFGIDVAISDAFALVGAPESLGGIGAAYLFDVRDGSFLRKLVPADGTPGDEFGISVALDGRLAIVGSRTDQEAMNAGSVYVFDVFSGAQLYKLTAPVAVQNSDFGWSVDLDGRVAAIGTSGKFAYVAHNILIPEPSSLLLLVGGFSLAVVRWHSWNDRRGRCAIQAAQ